MKITDLETIDSRGTQYGMVGEYEVTVLFGNRINILVKKDGVVAKPNKCVKTVIEVENYLNTL